MRRPTTRTASASNSNSPPDRAGWNHESTTRNSRDQCAAVCQRTAAPRPHGGIHPDRHLGALPAHARPSLHLRLRQRRARHADHAQGARGRHHARGADREIPRGPGRGLRRVPRRVRQLPHDAFAGKPRAGRGDLPRARAGRPHRQPHHPPGLRRPGGHVPARPLRARHLPALRRRGPVRRQLRGLRRHLPALGAEGRRLGAVRHDPGGARLGAPVLQAGRLRGDAEGLDGRGPAAREHAQQARGVVRGRIAGLGHQPRRAVLRLRDPGPPGQVLLRLAGRADRLHRQFPQSLRPQQRPRLRRVVAAGRKQGALPLHRQGHRVLPLAVLAGGAARLGLPHPDRGARARFPDGQRRKDVQIARHLHPRARLAGAPRPRGAALLLRDQARFRGGGHRPQPR